GGYPALWVVGIFTGGLTAFYVTRALYMTFHGQPRDHHLYDHAHESPAVMTIPLLILGAGSVLVGFVGFPPDNGAIHHFLAPVFEAKGGEAAHAPETGTFVALAAAAV